MSSARAEALVKFIWQLENWFFELGRAKSVALGIGVSLVLSIPSATILGEAGLLIPIFTYTPFNLWLAISIYIIFFSTFQRRRILRHDTNALSGFFKRMFSSYGLFCLGWWYTILFVGWLFGFSEFTI
jgi:hypothetical protein